MDNAEGVAKVHVETWRNTYSGIVSDEYLTRWGKPV